MAAESIGTLVPTKIPGLSDPADIQAALRLYHYGDYAYNTANASTGSLVSPSIAYTINSLQTQITAIDLSTALLKADFAAKGDLLSASADNTLSVLSVGSNGTVLTANSATASGLAWTTPDITLTNTATLTNKTLTAPVINISINPQTVAYELVLADNGKMVEVSSASPVTLSIPTNANQAFATGAQITILQTSTGQVTIAATTPGTTTVNGTPGLKLRAQWSSAVCIKRATDSWVVLGDLVA
jgi:hypothetical protein